MTKQNNNYFTTKCKKPPTHHAPAAPKLINKNVNNCLYTLRLSYNSGFVLSITTSAVLTIVPASLNDLSGSLRI